MKKVLMIFVLFIYSACAVSNTPDNHSTINIQNNLNAVINAQLLNYQNFAAPGAASSANCMTIDNYQQGGFRNGQVISINANDHLSLGSLTDIDGSTFVPSAGCKLGTNWQNRGAPAAYQLKLVINDQQNESFVINYNNYYCNGGSIPPRFNICNPQARCQLSYAAYPYSVNIGNNTINIIPGTSIKTSDGKFQLTFNINECNSNNPAVWFTLDYAAELPKINVAVSNTSNLTPILANYQAQGGIYDPNRPSNAGNFSYKIPPHTYSNNAQPLVAYTYDAGVFVDNCQYNYFCSDPSVCSVYGSAANTNKMLNCSQINTIAACENGICNTTFELKRLPSISFIVNNTSGQALTAQYIPAGSRYLPADPPPASGNNLNFTYSVAPNSQTISSQVEYHAANDICSYKYSWNGTAWVVSAINPPGNKLISCENSLCRANAENCTVNLDISKMGPLVPPIITANFKNKSTVNIDAISAAYGNGNQGIYNPLQAENPPGNFTYNFPKTVNSEANLITYTAKGDICTYGYNYASAAGCHFNLSNMAANKWIYCEAEPVINGDKCDYDLVIHDLPKLTVSVLNRSGLTLAPTYSGTGNYFPAPPPLPPANLDFSYSWRVNNLKDKGSVTYKSGNSFCTYSYSWNQDQCVVSIEEMGNKLHCAYNSSSNDHCSGNIVINNPSGNLYNIVVNNKGFTDLAAEANSLGPNIIEDGQTSIIPLIGPANTRTILTYYFTGIANIHTGCQFSIDWDENGNPISASAVQIGNNKDGASKLILNCVKPTWSENDIAIIITTSD